MSNRLHNPFRHTGLKINTFDAVLVPVAAAVVIIIVALHKFTYVPILFRQL